MSEQSLGPIWSGLWQEAFSDRHVGPDSAETAAMLEALGYVSLKEFVDDAVPARIRSERAMDLPAPFQDGLDEQQALQRLSEYAAQNRPILSLIGMGYHATTLPPVIMRNVLENPGWYTAYTPYQPEVSQGRLEALLNFQQMVMDLTGMEIANASLLDEATAAAEAMTMARRTNRKSSSSVFAIDANCHPQTLDVLHTRAAPLGIELAIGDPVQLLNSREAFGVLLNYPGSSGEIPDLGRQIEAARAAGAFVVVASDLLALTMLESPGALGADCVVGSAQRFGVPMSFGGPHAAFFATLDAYKRSVPGRIIGVSVDANGKTAFRMALQTREQHIRREKATSNICTAQVLLAVIAGFYAVYHGARGLRRIAARVHALTALLEHRLRAANINVTNRYYFDTLTITVPGQAVALASKAAEQDINLRVVDEDRLGISLNETVRLDHLATLLGIFTGSVPDLKELCAEGESLDPLRAIPLQRSKPILEHPNFSLYQSETEMLRYLRRLQSKDVALDRSMIPLGSCTMKLNATSEMLPISWPAFSAMHPFAPADQARGYLRLIDELEQMLCAVTGFEAVSLQPNAGSQGEYAGLLAIRRYHQANGDVHRDVCLIPSSAHGTNPASAIMAGMRVVVIGCDVDGNVNLSELDACLAQHGDRLAALMLTYPSTHGVFEQSVRDICDRVHKHGGQVYMDGANLNAMVGLSFPAELGADVSHMNLHKTFCIPHGGGGPGVGPIGVKRHLAPYLPGHRYFDATSLSLQHDAGRSQRAWTDASHDATGAVSAAPWGSAGILSISWVYIAMMGSAGLAHATAMAILNANYVAHRVGPYFPVVYSGPRGLVAHECIIDLRGMKDRSGVTVDDVAKRLVDFGFHAPTMSWPVPDTMMIEPTESESKAELDRFCDAMAQIRGEIAAIESGQMDPLDNPLKHAPHTAAVVVGEWDRAYSREQAAFPNPALRVDKYWPPVGRVDNAYGDRNLVCSCPALSDYAPVVA